MHTNVSRSSSQRTPYRLERASASWLLVGAGTARWGAGWAAGKTWWLSVVSLQLLLSELGIFGDADHMGTEGVGRRTSIFQNLYFLTGG
jgi:hypothetical protein